MRTASDPPAHPNAALPPTALSARSSTRRPHGRRSPVCSRVTRPSTSLGERPFSPYVAAPFLPYVRSQILCFRPLPGSASAPWTGVATLRIPWHPNGSSPNLRATRALLASFSTEILLLGVRTARRCRPFSPYNATPFCHMSGIKSFFDPSPHITQPLFAICQELNPFLPLQSEESLQSF